MEHVSGRTSIRDLTIGTLCLLGIPLLFVLDTGLAVRQGWTPASAGAIGKLPWLAAVFMAVVVLSLLLGSARRAISMNASRLCLFATSIFFAVVISDLLLRICLPQAGFHLRPPGKRYEYEPNSFETPGVFDLAHSTINSQGIRGPELTPRDDAYRILCVGSSTTECYYLDDSESWPALLGADLERDLKKKFWVGSAGFSEYATGHHLKFIDRSPLVGEMDAIVIMPGATDYLRLLLGLDMGTADPPVWIRSPIVGLFKDLWNARLKQGYVVDRTAESLTVRRMGLPFPPRKIDLPAALDAYATRLKSIVKACERRGVRLVMVSQPVMWDDFLTSLGNRRLRYARVYPTPRDWDYMDAGNLRRDIDQYNAVLEGVCKETGTGFVDGAKKLRGLEMYFYDDFHLNERGCKDLAQAIAEWFEKNPPKEGYK